MPKIWNKISTQLHTSFGGAVLLIIAVSLLTAFVLNHIKEIQYAAMEGTPEMRAAFSVAQQTAALVSAAPQIATAATLDQFEEVVATVSVQVRAFRTKLQTIVEKRKHDELMQQVQVGGATIIQNLEQIQALVRERFDLHQQTLALRNELRATHDELMTVLVNEIDNQFFYTVTGHRFLESAPSPRSEHSPESELQTYRHLVELRESATVTTQLLATAFTVTDAALLQPLREEFDATVGLANRSLDFLSNHPLHGQLSTSFSHLLSVGRRESNGFDLHGRELAVKNELSSLLHSNRILGVEIGALMENIVDDYSLTATRMTLEATQITETSSTLLLIINMVSIAGAILIGWIFVERRLSQRLATISTQIQRIAAGNLEVPIEVSGDDEIGELAKALEVFRQNALEVQRLSLVEQLADELKEMYQDLEKTNEKLKSAQDQIVMQEKLAALGQLTAGVAHEIKNPMNFIMNFAQVSKDLLDELLEEVAKGKPDSGEKEEYDPELVDEIAGDLTGNLERIHEHGTRANRIVMDMLKMGRHDSEDWQPTDISVLLNQHAMLAFHSARASDPDFQLDIQEDYAQDVGKIMTKARDLGRVFLNLVTNACYATDEKRKALHAGSDGGTESYMPTLKISTQLAGDHIEIHVRDNGNGIPESALSQIFNPFFTTKPPDKGTGLGLSLSSDIVREHGGEFRVDTKEGEYTDMIISLPLEFEGNLPTTDDAGNGTAKNSDDTEDAVPTEPD